MSIVLKAWITFQPFDQGTQRADDKQGLSSRSLRLSSRSFCGGETAGRYIGDIGDSDPGDYHLGHIRLACFFRRASGFARLSNELPNQLGGTHEALFEDRGGVRRDYGRVDVLGRRVGVGAGSGSDLLLDSIRLDVLLGRTTGGSGDRCR